jgi:hypothetical protein
VRLIAGTYRDAYHGTCDHEGKPSSSLLKGEFCSRLRVLPRTGQQTGRNGVIPYTVSLIRLQKHHKGTICMARELP